MARQSVKLGRWVQIMPARCSIFRDSHFQATVQLGRWSVKLGRWWGGGKTLCEILTVADAIPLPMTDPRVDRKTELEWGFYAVHQRLGLMKALAMVAVFAILAGEGGALAQPAFADHSESIVDIPTGSGACIDTNECYVPTDVRIDVGGEITWINNDIVSHSIESGTMQGGSSDLFGTGSLLIPPGGEYSFVFDGFELGTYPYFCLVHTWMAGSVTVVAAGEDGDGMEHDGMEHDGMEHDGMERDGMERDGMERDGMERDGMERDGMEKGDNMMMMEASATGMISDGTMVEVHATEPAEGERMEISVMFPNSEHVNYDITVTQNGKEVLSDTGAHRHVGVGIHMTAPLPSSDPVDITITFQGYGVVEPITGPIGEEVAFTNVVPEFGTVAVIILGVAITSTIAVTARSRIVPRI